MKNWKKTFYPPISVILASCILIFWLNFNLHFHYFNSILAFRHNFSWLLWKDKSQEASFKKVLFNNFGLKLFADRGWRGRLNRFIRVRRRDGDHRGRERQRSKVRRGSLRRHHPGKCSTRNRHSTGKTCYWRFITILVGLHDTGSRSNQAIRIRQYDF